MTIEYLVKFLVVLICFTLISLPVFVLNLLVLYLSLVGNHVEKNFKLFYANLSLSQLIVGIITGVFQPIFLFGGDQLLYSRYCAYLQYIINALGVITQLGISLISLHRYVTICFPTSVSDFLFGESK